MYKLTLCSCDFSYIVSTAYSQKCRLAARFVHFFEYFFPDMVCLPKLYKHRHGSVNDDCFFTQACLLGATANLTVLL